MLITSSDIKAIEDKINYYPKKVLIKNQLISVYECEEILKNKITRNKTT